VNLLTKLNAMPSQIRIGCRVSAAVGPFLPIAPERQNEGGRVRRHRSRYHGVVIRSFAEKQWTVYWEEVKKAADHFGNQLKFEKKAPVEGLVGLDLETILNNDYVKDQNGLDHALVSRVRAEQNGSRPLAVMMPPPLTAPRATMAPSLGTNHAVVPTANPASTVAPNPAPIHTTTTIAAATTPSPTDVPPASPEQDPAVPSDTSDEELDPDLDQEEDRYDPQTVLEDILQV
jgi:hypothetical protein